MKNLTLFTAMVCIIIIGCNTKAPSTQSTEAKVAAETEKSMAESQRSVGMPKIKNWREKRLANEIYEKRDQIDLLTHTYLVDMHGKFHYFGQTIGYGLPYATQYSNPEKIEDSYATMNGGGNWVKLPQPEPNGLYMSPSSSATWVMMKTDKGVETQYIESLINVFTFKLDDNHPQVASNIPLYHHSSEKVEVE